MAEAAIQAIETIDVVVFSAPQLSLIEMAQVAGMLAGRRAKIPLLVVTSPQVKGDADRMGLTARIEEAGGTVLSGMCFYQSYAREMAEANGWRRLATNSPKLVNIVMKRPGAFALPIVVVMIILIIPLGQLALGGISEKYLPPDNSVRLAQEEFDKTRGALHG